MDKINLKPNHRRSVSTSIRMVENMVDEIEQQVFRPGELLLTHIENQETRIDKEHLNNVIGEIRRLIRYLFEKYDLKTSELQLDRIIDSAKSSMWTILCDTTSEHLHGYGEFPPEYAREFDHDIDRLQGLIQKL